MTKPTETRIEYWFVFQQDSLLVSKEGGSTQILTATTVAVIKPAIERQHRLGVFDNFDVYCGELPGENALEPLLDALPLRKALEVLGTDWFNIGTKAYAIINWDKNHQFCGRCGNPTEHKSTTFERVCPACAQVFYPRISPSVIVLIQRGDELLMARSHHFSPGIYGLIAGFVEPGENLEEAVKREVMEEVSIKIKNLRYLFSQAWPFPDSLMMGFIADFESGDIVMDPVEIEDAGWYRFDQLPGRPTSKLSISSKLIDYYIDLKQKK